jgi:GNAT superfamily N-acetyltransferase
MQAEISNQSFNNQPILINHSSMDQITIRKANLQDMESLLRFEQGVIAAERPFDPTLKQDPVHYYNLPEMIEASHIELLVAAIDGMLIGSGYARIENSKHYLQHTQYAYLGFMYTEPRHRGKGVNRIIMEALKQWALDKNITELRLDVYYNNSAAIRAYRKVGFCEHMIEMRMPAL